MLNWHSRPSFTNACGLPNFLAHLRMIDPQRCGIAIKSDKFANSRGRTEGPAHCDLHSLSLVGCPPSREGPQNDPTDPLFLAHLNLHSLPFEDEG